MIIIEITEPEYRHIKKTIDRSKRASKYINTYMTKMQKERDEAFETIKRFEKPRKGGTNNGL